MATVGPSVGRRALAGALLLVLGLVSLAAYRVVAGSEHHSYAPGAVAPATVHLTQDHTYLLSVPGGLAALRKRGADVSTARCTYSVPGGSSQSLAAVAAGSDSKGTDAVATFISPVTGSVHVDCLGWAPVFVDDADGTKHDPSGWFLVASIVLLSIGLGLALSAAHIAQERRASSAGAVGEDEEIERLVRLVHVRSEDVEVAGTDGHDVTQ